MKKVVVLIIAITICFVLVSFLQNCSKEKSFFPTSWQDQEIEVSIVAEDVECPRLLNMTIINLTDDFLLVPVPPYQPQFATLSVDGEPVHLLDEPRMQEMTETIPPFGHLNISNIFLDILIWHYRPQYNQEYQVRVTYSHVASSLLPENVRQWEGAMEKEGFFFLSATSILVKANPEYSVLDQSGTTTKQRVFKDRHWQDKEEKGE